MCQVGSASTAFQPFSLGHACRVKGWLLPADRMGGREGNRHLLTPLAVTTSPPPAEIHCVQPLAVRLYIDQTVNNLMEAKILVPFSFNIQLKTGTKACEVYWGKCFRCTCWFFQHGLVCRLQLCSHVGAKLSWREQPCSLPSSSQVLSSARIKAF